MCGGNEELYKTIVQNRQKDINIRRKYYETSMGI